MAEVPFEGVSPDPASDQLVANLPAITGMAPVKGMADIINAGREAWQRRSRNIQESWKDWLLVGAALLVGRRKAQAIAAAKEPKGKRYNYAFGKWLDENGFKSLDEKTRRDLLNVMEHVEAHPGEFEAWLNKLEKKMPVERKRFTHPSNLWRVSQCKKRGIKAILHSNENAETTSAVGVDGDGEAEIEWQRGLGDRADKAARDSQMELWALPEPPDEDLRRRVQKAADKWAQLAQYLNDIANMTPDELGEARATVVHARKAAKAKKAKAH